MPKWTSPMLAGSLALLISGCGRYVGSHPTGTGPFDSNGNYIEAWADNPSKWNGRSVPKPSDKPKPAEKPKKEDPPAIVQLRPAPVQPSPRPVPVVKPKPKPKPKPKFAYHTVRKGDTLYGLAKRYGTTVGTIQKTNGVKGTLIKPGQRLKIPR